MIAFEGKPKSVIDIRATQLPAPYCKAVLENSVGFQLLLSAKVYILNSSAVIHVEAALIKEHPS